MTVQAMENTAPPGKTMSRDAVLDLVRGVAIILVVLGHVLVGIRSAGADTVLVRFLLIVIYSTHMALFFEVSGILSRGMAQRSWPEVGRQLGLRVVWPYILWSIVLLAAHFAMSGSTNTSLDTFAPWRILWSPPSVMWFLYVLFFAMLIMRALQPVSRTVMIGVAIALMAMAYGFDFVPQEGRWIGVFLIAAAVGRAGLERISTPVGYGLAGVVMLVTMWIAWTEAQGGLTGYPAGTVRYIPALVAGPLVLVWLCRRLPPEGWIAAALSFVGRYTMPIFVTHILVTAGTRIVLLQVLGIGNWTIIVIAGTLLGVCLPLVAATLADRVGVARLLGWR
ncbi:MAG: acyltransferase [Sulfitobacter sp.]